jgi:hypothetical protein
MRSLYLSFAVLVAGGKFGLVDECLSSKVEACGGQADGVGVDFGVIEDIFGFICVSHGMQTFGSISWDEASVSRQVRWSWLE